MALRSAAALRPGFRLFSGTWRCSHAMARPFLTDDTITLPTVSSPPVVLPELDSPPAGSMELMAVPKRRVTHHKKGIRNGPKALKPVPVIIRCKCCGRAKLPHFYCCSGDRGNTNEENVLN